MFAGNGYSGIINYLLSPAGGSMVLEIVSCPNNAFWVRFRINSSILLVPGCGSQGWCNYDRFRRVVGRQAQRYVPQY